MSDSLWPCGLPPRDQTQVSCLPALAGGLFITSATWEHLSVSGASPVAQLVIYLHFTRQKAHRFSPCVGKLLCRRKWPPTLVFLPAEFHGQRSLAGFSPWGRKELDMTQCLNTHTASLVTINFTFSGILCKGFFFFFMFSKGLLFRYLINSVHLLSRVRLFVTPCTAARQASLSITNSWLVMPSNHLILCHLLLLVGSW